MRKDDIKKNINDRKIVKFNMGKDDNIVAFVFSCPGQEELKNDKVLSGKTGQNLDCLLSFLTKKRKDIFPSDRKEEYLLTNSSQHVYYKGYKGSNRTEAYKLDLDSQENTTRLKQELENKKVVICFGKKAKYVVSKINLSGKIINIIHIGQKSLNCIKVDIANNEIKHDDIKGTSKRLEVIAEEIIENVKGYLY